MIKESKKIDKYLNLAREQKILWNMWVTVIPIVIGALGMVPKGQEKKTGGTRDQRKNRGHPDHREFEWQQVSSDEQDSSQYSAQLVVAVKFTEYISAEG